MNADTWRESHLRVIDDALRRYRAESAPWVTDEQLLKLIRRREYKLAQRRGYGYKSWLAAIRDRIDLSHGKMPHRAKRGSRRPKGLAQLSFESVSP